MNERTKCLDCGYLEKPDENIKKCPKCKDDNTNIVVVPVCDICDKKPATRNIQEGTIMWNIDEKGEFSDNCEVIDCHDGGQNWYICDDCEPEW